MTLADVAAVTGGRLDPGDQTAAAAAALVVDGPAFHDSRTPQRGGLFVAIVGERVDGHDFAPQVVAAGAVGVLGGRPTGVPTVVVADPVTALQALAGHVLGALRRTAGRPQVVAITGSQGKTTAKDMLAAILRARAPTVATPGSFNNELGLPLTVLRADGSTRFLVLEMGARGVGHLADLCRIAPPDVAVVLNVGVAHLGEFGSQEAIATAKGELVEALRPDGLAVLNLDDERVAAMSARTRARVRTFGRAHGADVRVEGMATDAFGRAAFDLAHHRQRVHVSLQVPGEHLAGNAAAAAAAALFLGVELGDIGTSLDSLRALSPGRMQLFERPDGLVVLDDSYNANPDSTAAALRTLAGIGRVTGRRTVAVLGEMRELGEAAEESHRAVGRLAAEAGIDVVLVVGDGARAVVDGCDTAVFVSGVPDAIDWLRDNVHGPEVLLVKASRAVGLERVARAMTVEGVEETNQ